MTEIIPVVLAGGGGTRLWPLSREHYPKQFLQLVGDGTLLQQTLARVCAASGYGTATVLAPIVICNEEHRFLVAEQARVTGVELAPLVLEPVARNTAPALTAAALRACAGGSDPLLLMTPADQIVRDGAAFARAIAAAVAVAAPGRLVTFGVVPDRPETGYGYIHAGAPLGDGGPVRHLRRFVEKPDADTAARYLHSGEYLWNSGMFLMPASTWLAAVERLRPDILAAVREAVETGSADGPFFRLQADAMTRCPSDSIDYAVMEKLAGQPQFEPLVVPFDAGWSDVGSWLGLWQIAPRDAGDNVIDGDVLAVDASGNVALARHRLVALLGCRDMVVVETADAVLVMPRDRAQDVKRIVEQLRAHGRDERLTHRRVYRPWGSYEGIDAGERFQVKRIVVKPGQRLSLQMHHHRAEHWIVVRGTARVSRDGEEFLLSENQSTYIPLGVTHRLENPGTIALEIIEVQSGAYLGEDDIVRFDDAYDRHRDSR
ncbi:MAG: mannose-1-phosphate guanylyltransferase/mannose-6-phosphate isomerase [Gammaproteobacteria bacterium]|nr:mannose-1-phosphate guanylyltransferase/mannose-6-phosphate isomerase [Gammaproteobacteria bacterium]